MVTLKKSLQAKERRKRKRLKWKRIYGWSWKLLMYFFHFFLSISSRFQISWKQKMFSFFSKNQQRKWRELFNREENFICRNHWIICDCFYVFFLDWDLFDEQRKSLSASFIPRRFIFSFLKTVYDSQKIRHEDARLRRNRCKWSVHNEGLSEGLKKRHGWFLVPFCYWIKSYAIAPMKMNPIAIQAALFHCASFMGFRWRRIRNIKLWSNFMFL